jgi:hypothetical protein
MDGSKIVIPSASLPTGLAREDALFRIVYYGEALRAMTEHVSDTLISGPCVPMIELLDEAFDRMSETRDTFGPEEFTLFVLSKMLGLCDDDEARQFQVGAAEYILKSADALPDHYRPVVDDARQMLRRTAALALTEDPATTTDEPAPPPVATPEPAPQAPPTAVPEAVSATPVTGPTRDQPTAASTDDLTRVGTGTAPMASAATRTATPAASRAPRVSATASRTALPRSRLHVTRVRGGGRVFGAFEKFLGFAVLMFFVGLLVFGATGLLEDFGSRDPGTSGVITRDSAVRAEPRLTAAGCPSTRGG